MGPDGPRRGKMDFFPTDPDLADILGRTDFDFENFWIYFGFFGSQIFGPLDFRAQGPSDFRALGPEVYWSRNFQKSIKIYIWAQGPEVCRALGPEVYWPKKNWAQTNMEFGLKWVHMAR